MLNEIKNTNAVLFHLYEVFSIDTLIRTKGIGGCQRLGGGEMWSYCLTGNSVSDLQASHSDG